MARGDRTGWARGLAVLLVMAWPAVAGAQAAADNPTPTAPAAPATTPAPPAAPATPVAPPPVAAPMPPNPAATPPAAGEAAPDKPADTSISQTLDLPTRTAVVLSGKSSWDDGFKTIMDSFAKLNDAVSKNGLVASGHPLAVFTETDDNGFSFSAELPIEKAPEGKTEITPDIKVGPTPGGKAMRFQHRGSYEEIDATYEAITAYLDEKGLESRNLFAEEYLDQVKSPDDSNLEVDIYVFLK